MRRSGWVAGIVLVAVAGSVVSIVPAQTAGDGYVDAAVCATCHVKEAAGYQLTGMGRSFYRPGASHSTEDFSRGLPYYHEASATYFGMSERNGRYFQSQYQVGFDGKPTNFSEKRIDYVVGSGNHARTYLSRTARNELIELPLAWYAEKGGYWAMNPGYDKAEHDGFARKIEYNCVFCHNAYPKVDGKAVGNDAVFPAVMPEGIDCQRCHGPGAAHVAAQGKAPMVNPKKQGEVCLQCHLETTSFPLPNSIRRYEREPFSFRAGEALTDFRLDFDHKANDAHEIAGSASELEQSKCVLKSGAKLSCTTCHDPHDVKHGAEGLQQYNAVCKDCHKTLAVRHTASAECVDCHMPKRRTADAVHVVMTDHRIQRVKPAGDLLADLAETPHVYRGEVRPYRSGGDELYTAEAQVIDQSNLAAGIPRLTAAIAKLQPTRAEHYAVLADALRAAGNCEKAVSTYKEALRRDPEATVTVQNMAQCLAPADAELALKAAIVKTPENPQLWAQLGLVQLRESKAEDALASLVRATRLDQDMFEAWNDLGELWLQGGDVERAEPALRLALRVKPNSPVAHSNLGDLLSRTNRLQEARYEFEMALRYRPEDAGVHLKYGLALGRARRYAEAQVEMEKSVKVDARDAEAHHALGVVLAAQNDGVRAIAEYREAVRLRPEFALANLSLGAALVSAGEREEGLRYLRVAAESAAGPVREQARRLLNTQ